uniref:Uncharacterized protein n=1 Tax=Oryza nivara TaxID=4536 RepID=A0A0E0J1R7_ORYNI
MGKEASAMVARRSTSHRDWRRWWWWLLPLACCFVCWVASSAATVAPAAGVAVTSLPGFDGPLPFSLETGDTRYGSQKHQYANTASIYIYRTRLDRNRSRDSSIARRAPLPEKATARPYQKRKACNARLSLRMVQLAWARLGQSAACLLPPPTHQIRTAGDINPHAAAMVKKKSEKKHGQGERKRKPSTWKLTRRRKYVEVNESTGVRLFYYFVQSEKDPDVDPLLLWLSGGPGCSSLSGLTHEIDYSCAYIYRTIPICRKTVSNIIFVDSPVGAGFSYAATQEGSKTSDTKTVKQLVIFLRKWLHDHPQFLLNPLYIGGDSYSGYIVPTLALAIDESNDSGDKPILNLMYQCGLQLTFAFHQFLYLVYMTQGYVAGNPRTERQFDEGGKIPFLHGMGLISNELYEHAKETCRGKYNAPGNARCEQSMKVIHDCTKDINMLHVLEPFCEDVGSPGME